MRTLGLCALLMGTSSIVSADRALISADYQPGWDAQLFYDEVLTCRTAIVLPAVNAYMKRGVAAKMDADALRKETISMLPLFEHAALASCFCAVNETAKLKDYKAYFGSGDFTNRTKLLKEQFDLPVCSASMEAAVADMTRDKETAMSMRLK